MAKAGEHPNTSPSQGAEGDQPAYAGMIARARALVPQLCDRATRTEELRRLPPETERELHDSGLFGSCSPNASAVPNSTMSR